MKNIIYILSIFLFLGCQKEDSLTPSIQYEHLYGIVNNPNDPVQQKVYDIYTKYGVPVYFNDTIGKMFVREDVYGDSIYRYETLDLAWGFTSNSGVKFRYDYLQDADQKLAALSLVEDYLELVPKPLYPFNFFIVNSASSVDAAGNVSSYGDNKQYAILFRTLLLMNGEGLDANLPLDLRMNMIKQKIANYKTELELFHSVCQSSWYYQMWSNLDPSFYEFCTYPYSKEYQYDYAVWYGPYYDAGDASMEMFINIPENYMTSSTLFAEDWSNASRFLTAEGLEQFRAMVRKKMGAWGFVQAGIFTAQSKEADLNAYLNEMLSMSRKEFEARWGSSPLVMEKYDIIYDIVANEFGVEL